MGSALNPRRMEQKGMCLPKMEPLVVVSRDTWGALPPKEKGSPLQKPVAFVVITLESGTEEGKTEEDCKKIMQDLQKNHMEEKGMTDIAYNFVVGGDGQVYEGRGWESEPGILHSSEYTTKRVDIAYMGNQNRDTIPWNMFKAAIQLIDEGTKNGIIDEEHNSIEYPQQIKMPNE